MRRLITTLVAAAMLAVPVAAPVAAACPRPEPTVAIAARTSHIYLYDGSSAGTGPSLPAVTVRYRVKNCPPASLTLNATLVQHGVTMGWASTALGSTEVECQNMTAGQRKSFVLTASFYGATLHSGRALARVALVDWTQGGLVVAEDTRRVRIP